jgi:hypothetical protein
LREPIQGLFSALSDEPVLPRLLASKDGIADKRNGIFSEEEIDEKSMAYILAKGFAVVQSSWLIGTYALLLVNFGILRWLT